MNFLNNFRILSTALLVISFGSCKSMDKKENHQSKTDFKKVHENYIPFHYLETNITLSGYMDKNQFSYPGKIIVENNQENSELNIVFTITDPVFLSPIFKITLEKNNLYYHDILQNREENSGYKDSGIYFMSNYIIPSEVLLPICIGIIPDQFLTRGKKIKNGIYMQKANGYILTGTYENNILTSYKLENEKLQNPVLIQMVGNKSNQMKRYFPEKIKIIFPENDHIEIKYNKIILK